MTDLIKTYRLKGGCNFESADEILKCDYSNESEIQQPFAVALYKVVPIWSLLNGILHLQFSQFAPLYPGGHWQTFGLWQVPPF